MRNPQRLVVVSNRVPSPPTSATSGERRADPVGGLVSALRGALEEQGGLWFGWSGNSTGRRSSSPPSVLDAGPFQLATLDLSDEEVSLYYTGFANRTLWPLLHSFPERVTIRHDTNRVYRRVNQQFAEALYPMLQSDDLVWVHDYHLFHLGQELRRTGWTGKIGFFLHVPFPPSDIFAILPWARQLLESLLHYDLVGVHTDRYLQNLVGGFLTELGGNYSDGTYSYNEDSVRLGAYPLGIEPSQFQPSAEQRKDPSAWRSQGQVILGVDRLDYTKGLPERLRAFETLIERYPSLRGKVTFIQVSSPSRTRVPEYLREKELVDRLVGNINGRFSQVGWVPIRYLYRFYTQDELTRFYRDADVCLVTPLRDGMNLVAQEFVASQGDDPGVLVLSRFTGAADAMHEALIVNPYDIDGTADATYRALQMGLRERRRRWRVLIDVVRRQSVTNWRDTFRRDLSLT